jgi:hypothetical protein
LVGEKTTTHPDQLDRRTGSLDFDVDFAVSFPRLSVCTSGTKGLEVIQTLTMPRHGHIPIACWVMALFLPRTSGPFLPQTLLPAVRVAKLQIICHRLSFDRLARHLLFSWRVINLDPSHY